MHLRHWNLNLSYLYLTPNISRMYHLFPKSHGSWSISLVSATTVSLAVTRPCSTNWPSHVHTQKSLCLAKKPQTSTTWTETYSKLILMFPSWTTRTCKTLLPLYLDTATAGGSRLISTVLQWTEVKMELCCFLWWFFYLKRMWRVWFVWW